MTVQELSTERIFKHGKMYYEENGIIYVGKYPTEIDVENPLSPNQLFDLTAISLYVLSAYNPNLFRFYVHGTGSMQPPPMTFSNELQFKSSEFIQSLQIFSS